VIPIGCDGCLDCVVRKLRYLTVVLALVEVVLVAGLAYDVLVARENASAYSDSPVHDSLARADDSDSSSYGGSLQTTYSVDDGYQSDRWGISKIEAPEAWEITKGDASVIVAVLDTGIDKDNQDLAGRVVAEVNFTNSPTSDDRYGHGTHMAGTIAAIAPGCRLMNVKVADDAGKCEPSVVASGIVLSLIHISEPTRPY